MRNFGDLENPGFRKRKTRTYHKQRREMYEENMSKSI